MDFFVNGTGAAYSVGFANFTSYLPVTAGAVSVSAHRAGSLQTVSSAEGTLSGGRQYTVVVSHGPGNQQQRIYQDQDAPAPPGQIALRVVNAIEGSGTTTVYVSPTGGAGGTGAPVSVLNVAPGSATAYVNLPASTAYAVTATVAEGALNVPLSSTTVKAGSGAVRTVVFAGNGPAGTKNVVGFVLDDADAP